MVTLKNIDSFIITHGQMNYSQLLKGIEPAMVYIAWLENLFKQITLFDCIATERRQKWVEISSNNLKDTERRRAL